MSDTPIELLDGPFLPSKPRSIAVEAIAAVLACVPRFVDLPGYSRAEHSWLRSLLAPKPAALHALLDDVSATVLCGAPTSVAELINRTNPNLIARNSRRIKKAAFAGFGLSVSHHRREIYRAETLAVALVVRDRVGPGAHVALVAPQIPEGLTLGEPMSPTVAATKFVERFYELREVQSRRGDR